MSQLFVSGGQSIVASPSIKKTITSSIYHVYISKNAIVFKL